MNTYQKKMNLAFVVSIVIGCFFIAAFNIKAPKVAITPAKAAKQSSVNQITKANNNISTEATAYLFYDGKSEKPHFVGILGNEVSKQLHSLTTPCEEGAKFSADYLKSADLPKNVTSVRRVYFENINLTVRKKGNFLNQSQFINIQWDDIKKYSEDGDEVHIEFNATKVKNAQGEWLMIDSGSPYIKRIFPDFNLNDC